MKAEAREVDLNYGPDSEEVELCRFFVKERQKKVIGFKYPGKGLPRDKALKAIQDWASVFHQMMKEDGWSVLQIELMISERSHGIFNPTDLRSRVGIKRKTFKVKPLIPKGLGREGFFKLIRERRG